MRKRDLPFVESRSGAPRLESTYPLSAPFEAVPHFGFLVRTFPDPAPQTGRAHLGHPAFVQEDSCFRPRSVGGPHRKPKQTEIPMEVQGSLS